VSIVQQLVQKLFYLKSILQNEDLNFTSLEKSIHCQIVQMLYLEIMDYPFTNLFFKNNIYFNLLERAQPCQPSNLAIAVPIAKTVKSGHRIIAKQPARFIMNKDFILIGLFLQSVWGRCHGNTNFNLCHAVINNSDVVKVSKEKATKLSLISLRKH